ncbi:unnamed protein product [Lactuca saligna]|uniref:Protein kinase domain-containing protein n=1 Tax=Lactuca saligna TaxID=75948 RepID=A0AA35ZS76_LACSI|nr:unnamed protein product [Lactuca saligna]
MLQLFDIELNIYEAHVAVKILRSEHLNDETLGNEFAHEVAMLREVQHADVVRFIGACMKKPPLCIITEYMPGGSLYEYLHKNHSILKLPQLVKFVIDVCKGMENLHNNNIIHRDFKTANLLMDTQNVVKVADFGFARGIDLRCSGCILAELLAGKPIMPGRTEVEQLYKIFKLCGSPSDEYWKKSKLPHATIFKPQQSYRRCIAETFKEFPASSLPLIDTLLSIDPS